MVNVWDIMILMVVRAWSVLFKVGMVNPAAVHRVSSTNIR